MSEKEQKIVETTDEKPQEDWMSRRWRPLMGYQYMLVCMCDFVIFPVLWAIYHAVLQTGSVTQWQPLTLQGAGLYHLAMGAIIGVAAFGRTQEKIAGANNGGMQMPGFGSMSGTGFGSSAPTPPSFNRPGPTTSCPPPPAFGSRPAAPPRADMPEL